MIGLGFALAIYHLLGWQGVVGGLIGGILMEASAAYANGGQWRD